MSLELPIPEKLRERLFDGLVEGIAGALDDLPLGKHLAKHIRKLRSDNEFYEQLKAAFLKASETFVEEYSLEDAELAKKIVTKSEFFDNVEIRKELVYFLKNSDQLASGAEKIPTEHFETIFPGIKQDRIQKAVAVYLHHLAKAVWQISEFQPVYHLLFQRVIAETSREQLNISRTQLQVSTEIKTLLEKFPFKSRSQRLLNSTASLALPLANSGQDDDFSSSAQKKADSLPHDAITGKNLAPNSTLQANLKSALENASALFLHENTERMLNAKPLELQIILFDKISEFTRLYHQFGNPILIYEAANALAQKCAGFLDAKPFELGRLHALLGYLLINADPDIKAIKQAREHLEIALNIIDNQQMFNQEILKVYLRASWLHAVAIKIEGDFDTAFNLLINKLEDKQLKRLAGIHDAIPLVRQRVIMEQTKSAHDELFNSAQGYKKNAAEYFHSVRRVFEYALNTQNFETIDELYNLCQSAFKRCRAELDKVYIYTYLKNVYHYLMLKGQLSPAARLYKRITKETMDLNLMGQHRQILDINRMFETIPISGVKLKSATYSNRGIF
jgi:hypothetical protein